MNPRYLQVAKTVSAWSKDPSRQVGAVFVKDDVILSTGYNGFPRKFDDSPELYSDKDIKSKFIVHAEMNAIFNAARNGTSLEGSTLYCWGLPVCVECSKALIQVGVKRIVWDCDEAVPSKWNDQMHMAKQMLDYINVPVEKVNSDV